MTLYIKVMSKCGNSSQQFPSTFRVPCPVLGVHIYRYISQGHREAGTIIYLHFTEEGMTVNQVTWIPAAGSGLPTFLWLHTPPLHQNTVQGEEACLGEALEGDR